MLDPIATADETTNLCLKWIVAWNTKMGLRRIICRWISKTHLSEQPLRSVRHVILEVKTVSEHQKRFYVTGSMKHEGDIKQT